ncbi:MAG: anaerobic sulfatase maturase [Synergistaceae bacterium]|nr:anaerobic sulfatase maturase [Synergistaceae bacterium]
MGVSDTRAYAIMAKPVGSACNLRCSYCYYIGKDKLFGRTESMGYDVLKRYISENIRIHGRRAAVEFAWHGGEPTLRGLDFYRRAMELQREYGTGRKILNNIQTNGTFIDEEWCAFLRDNKFAVGLSVDGPEQLHDANRKGVKGDGSFSRAIDAARLFKKFGVPFNVLATVNSVNAGHPAEVYDLASSLSDFIQFLPVVERGGELITVPPGIHTADEDISVTPQSVSPESYGDFLCKIFDIWASRDVGEKFVQMFEAAIGNMTGRPAGICVHEAVCGHTASLEADGSLYSCDRYTFDEYRLGNIMDSPLDELMESNRAFGTHKAELTQECEECRWLPLCRGGCPKDRFLPTADGKYKNYLCAGYKKFFSHIAASVRFVKE